MVCCEIDGRRRKMTTKAVVLQKAREFESIQIVDAALKDMGSDDVEVRVHYCGVNFTDVYHSCQQEHSVPFTIGMECSGVVTNVGANVEDAFRIGDRVICYDYNGGLHQEIVRLSYKKCYKLPEGVDLELAAASFVQYFTAWSALVSIGNISDNHTIYIGSCAGGVGLAALKISKHLRKNVRIIGTSSESKRAFLEDNGVVWTSYDAIEDLDETFDLAIVAHSTKERTALMGKLKPFGKCVIIGAKDLVDPKNLADYVITHINPIDLIYGNKVVAGLHIGIIAEHHPHLVRHAMDAIFALMIANESMKPVVKVLPFQDAKCGYRLLKDRQNIGKIVLQCDRQDMDMDRT